MTHRPHFLFWCLLLLAPAACAHRSSPSPYANTSIASRDPAEAERLNRRAAEVITSNPDEAERLLRLALSLDLYCGPAHNNLGTLLLGRGELYEAAGEFEWAAKLMPGHPDPRMNLGFALELAGRTDESLASYRTALEVRPEHIQSVQALARLQIISGRTDDTTQRLLETIAFRGENDEWKTWAREWMIKRSVAH